MVAEPGHFHAALVLKSLYPDVNQKVFVYAPPGTELNDFLSRVEGYRNRFENPALWELETYTGPDFFDRMLSEKPGNVLVLAGNNRNKTEYINRAIKAGIHVFADKPMAINPNGFTMLEESFKMAEKNGLLLYDIMTERFEITSILQRELSRIPEIFGKLLEGSPEDPAVVKESVHHFFKYVSGTRLIRPPWFYDVEQEGEGIVDVTTHLADLVQWTCFPEQVIDYKKDIRINSSHTWNTPVTPAQFLASTAIKPFPDYLLKYVGPDSILMVACNGEINYRIKGINARISVRWDFEPPPGGGDTHYSVMKGSLARIEIRQGAEQKFIPELYVLPVDPGVDHKNRFRTAMENLAARYPGLSFEEAAGEYHVIIPDIYRVGHEAHFGQVTENFLNYLKEGRLPGWEVPNMLAKYWLTTKAREIVR